jgi:dihydrofolate reductase
MPQEARFMRKVLQSTLISIDGVVSDPGRWAMPYFTHESAADALAQLHRSDAMLLGRVTYTELAARWSGESGNFADALREIQKFVFSSTLKAPTWENTLIVASDPAAHVSRLKEGGDGDLTVYGYGRFGRLLLESGLVDEVVFSIHPVIVGGGTDAIDAPPTSMALTGVRARESGVIVATYRVEQPSVGAT